MLDDDRSWKARIGWTINAGHPTGIAILVVAALALVGVVVAATLGIRAR